MADVTPAAAATAATPAQTAQVVIPSTVPAVSTFAVLTEATSTTPFGFATKAQADSIIKLVAEMRQTLINAGLVA